MIGCEYLDNFLPVFLHGNLSNTNYQISTDVVNSFLLILSKSAILSTILFSGAKLISLYLFSAKNSGNLSFLWLITLLISRHRAFFRLFCG